MDFVVPKLSTTMETATVLRWLKQAGEQVKLGELIVELETDKAAMEVEASGDGTLATLAAAEGAVVPIGGLLATIDADGAAAAPRKPTTTRIPASPLARRLAKTHGIELTGLASSGPYGRRRKRDVLAAIAMSPSPVSVSPSYRQVGAETVEPLSPMRGRIAESVSASRRTIPAFALDRWVETRAIGAARQAIGPDVEQATGIRLTLTDFLLQAMADTLGALPRVLGRFAEAEGRLARVMPAAIDIGLVVATGDGMMIPVVRDLRGKSLGAIAAMRQAAVQRVRAGRLIAADAEPASITLSNLGRSGADRFDAIISPGQSSIVAAGREQERVIDGQAGAEFLGMLTDRIERGPWTAA